MAKKALMACSIYWNSVVQVGSHHIARNLVKLGYEVAFIYEPISIFHLLKFSNETIDKFKIYIKNGIYDLDKNLWAYVPFTLYPHFNNYFFNNYWNVKNWYKLTYPNLGKIIKAKGFTTVDLLYIDSCLQPFWFDLIKYKKAVYRIADKNSDFIRTTNYMIENEKKIAESVDKILYTANNLKEYAECLKPGNSIYFPNGVNLNFFINGTNKLPEEYLKLNRPIIIYVGAVKEWFNFELINKAANMFPQYSFVIIGPGDYSHFKKSSNLVLLGPKPYNQLPAYIKNADIGIIPFNNDKFPELINSINPLKAYEYMACGLPVLSVEMNELKFISAPVNYYQNENEFFEFLKLIRINKESNKYKYIDFVSQMDWNQKVLKMLSNIGLE